MSKIRNAVLAGVLATGIAGAGVLAAAPADAAQEMTLAGGTLIDATGTAGETLTMAATGPVWNFSEPVITVNISITVPEGTKPVTERIVVGSWDYLVLDDSNKTDNVWSLTVSGPATQKPPFSTVSLPSIKLTQTTPQALQGQVTYEVRQVRYQGVPDPEPISGPALSATVTWTDPQVDTPLIAPAIGAAAAVAGLGVAGFALLRRRRAAQEG